MTKQARRTAARKARQEAALAEYKRRVPEGVRAVDRRSGAEVEVTVQMLQERSKRLLVEGYKRGFR